MNVFGEQNLKEFIDNVLEEQGLANYVANTSISGSSVDVSVLKGKSEMQYKIFESLFNPEDGFFSEIPEDLSYQTTLYESFEMVYESHYPVGVRIFSGDDIRRMRRDSINTGEYSEEKFREMYGEVR